MTRSAQGWGLAALVSVSLAGCQLAPEHAPPVTASPQAWRESSVTTNWPGADWWRGFQSSELDQLLKDAEAHNDDLLAAEARVREADGELRIAGAALLPTVGLSSDAGELKTVNMIGKERHYGDASVSVGVSYELDFWGKNRAAKSAAKATAEAAVYDREVVRLTVMTSVANTYFQARALQDQLQIAQQTADLAKATLQAMQAEHNQGVIDAQTLTVQEAQVQSLEAATDPIAQQLTHMRNALAILTGRSLETLNIDGAPLDAIATPGLGAGVPSELLLHRPDVQRAEAALASANANITVARAQFLPSFNLAGQYGVGGVMLASGASPFMSVYSLAAGMTQPIFDGGRLHGQLDQTRARYSELLADYSKTTRQAFVDVEDALNAEQKTAAAEKADGVAVDRARQAFAMSKAGYDAGAVNLLALQAARAAVLPAQSALDQARLTHLQSLVLLYQALGGGWSLNGDLSAPGSLTGKSSGSIPGRG